MCHHCVIDPLKQHCDWGQVLLEESTQRVPAALHGLAVFVDTLRLLVDAQRAVAASDSSPHDSPPQHSQARDDSASPMEEDPQAASHAQRSERSGVQVNQAGGQDANEDTPKGAAAVVNVFSKGIQHVKRCSSLSTAWAFMSSSTAAQTELSCMSICFATHACSPASMVRNAMTCMITNCNLTLWC